MKIIEKEIKLNKPERGDVIKVQHDTLGYEGIGMYINEIGDTSPIILYLNDGSYDTMEDLNILHVYKNCELTLA